ncbi:MAG: tRNA(fMet)-specific endonuclease VapC [bacterium]|nr:tRNA(fMet)-specific endonuclease VapC [bacterium]
MTLIDSSVWIDFLRPAGAGNTKETVATLLREDRAAFSCPTYYELINGVKDHEEADLERTLLVAHREPFRVHHWNQAAELARLLRKQRINLPHLDILLSAVALETGWPILCADRHFDTIRDKGDARLQVIQLAPA